MREKGRERKKREEREMKLEGEREGRKKKDIKLPMAPSGRARGPKDSLVALMKSLVNAKPSTFEEAVKKKEWKEAMMEEYQSIMKNDVWEIVPRLERKSVVTSKWVYKIKHAVDGSIDKYKARFVARGFSQKEGEYYDETFAPVARYSSIRSIISLTTLLGWNLHQIDV